MRLKREKEAQLLDGSPSKKPINNNERIINSYLNDKNMNEYEKIEAVKRKAV
jgi:hypothetical protein